MPYGMYISANGADVQSQRLEIISNNLANADTPGFKREMAILQAQHAEAIQAGDAVAGSGSINDVGGGVSLLETVTDFSRGNLRATGKPTDLAIDGDGFFLVDRDGQQMLTRAGNFHFTNAGRLATEQGYPVLTPDGLPVTIDPTQPFRFDETGNVVQADTRIPIGLVRPQSYGDLAQAGENLFNPLAPVQPVLPQDRRVVNGFLEMSTVKPTLEMMELIETSRAYEANVKMIQNQDQMLGSLVNRVLRQS